MRKLKRHINKFAAVALTTSIVALPVASTFGASAPVFAADAVSSATVKEAVSNLTEGTTPYEISFRHITATYVVDVYVSNDAALIEGIVDKSTDTPGFTGSIWGQFKGEGGLSKYAGKTFVDIKRMPIPDEIPVMGGTDTTPVELHQEIMNLIARLEKEDVGNKRKNKAKLAQVLYQYKKLYNSKGGGDYTPDSMGSFLDSYAAAKAVLNNQEVEKSDVDIAKRNLDTAIDRLVPAAPDYTKFKTLQARYKEIIANEENYTLISIAYLKKVYASVEQFVNSDAKKTPSKVNEEVAKLEKALSQVVTKEDGDHRFVINGKIGQEGASSTESMANQFMNPEVSYVNKDNKNIYKVFFKKGVFQGLTADILTFKHIENGKEISATVEANDGEYGKSFTFERQKADENEIHILLGAKMAGPDISEMPAVLVLDQTSKRQEGETLQLADKRELKKVIDVEKQTYEDVINNEYSDVGAKEYLKKYQKALEVLEDKMATQETVDQAAKVLKSSKDLDLSLKILAPYGQKLEELEEYVKGVKAGDNQASEYSLEKMENLVKEYNKDWNNRHSIPKVKLQKRINNIDYTLANTNLKKYEMLKENDDLLVANQNSEMVFRSEAPVEKFKKLYVDTYEVPAEKYTVTSGSTIITLKPEYTNELPLGMHDVTILSEDGEATAVFAVTEKLPENQEEQFEGTKDPEALAEGKYQINGDMYKFNVPTSLSMANQAIEKPIVLVVKDGKFSLQLTMKPISIGEQQGALGSISYMVGDEEHKANVLKEGMLGTEKYPEVVEIPVQFNQGEVVTKIFVPIMEEIAKGHGTQKAILKLDWSSLKPFGMKEETKEETVEVLNEDNKKEENVATAEVVTKEEVKETTKEVPNTGDSKNVGIYIISIISGVVAAGAIITRKLFKR